MSNGGISVLFFVVSIITVFGYAGDMSATEVYAKCYARLSDHPVDIDSLDYKQVQSGALDPIAACEKLIENASLVNKKGQFLLKDTSDDVAIATLRNLNQFHLSWFNQLGSAATVLDRGLFSYYDHTEPALYITDALFRNKHYKTIFTRNDSIRGVRLGSPELYLVSGTNLSMFTFFSGPFDGDINNTAKSNFQLINFPRVPVGKFIGIQPQPKMDIQLYKGIIESPLKATSYPSFKEESGTYNLSQHSGGGILGSSSYLIMNSENLQRLDGGAKIHRRMANNTFHDLMCLTMPNLMDSDVDAYLSKYKNSQLSFRRDRSCARCHATLDPFANTARNFTFLRTTSSTVFTRNLQKSYPSTKTFVDLRLLKKFQPIETTQTTVDVDNMYHRREPVGQLFYRDYNGTLINRSVIGVGDLGNKIAQQDDIYICAAQKYYGFLTGIHIPVSTRDGDEFYQNHRTEIIRIGKEFKKHGSLKRMIGDILRTNAFQTRFPGLVTQREGF